MSARRATLLGVLVLVVFTAWFDHRVWSAMPVLEGDAPQNVYYWRYPELAEAGYDPAGRDYFALLPVHGTHSPIRWALIALSRPFTALASPTAVALAGNMALAFVLHLAVALGAFLYLRSLDRSVPGALIGASVVAYTGFHLVGVREFDTMYLGSMAAVFPTLWALSRLALDGRAVAGRAAVAAIAIGLSLLGGSNVPLFYYLPFIVALPLIVFAWARSRTLLAHGLAGGLAAVIGGFAIGSPAVLDGLRAVAVQMRGVWNLAAGPFAPLPELLRTFVLRDWWEFGQFHFHERDVFLGVPVLVLVVVGLVRFTTMARKRAASPDADVVVGLAMLGCVALALVVLNYNRLPAPLRSALSFYYDVQSIRHPLRFGLLLLVPAAHFASLGFDRLSGRAFPIVAAVAALVAGSQVALLPGSEMMQRVPDARVAATLSLAAGAVALIAIAWRWRRVASQPAAVLAVLSVFAMFLVAPMQLTGYARWLFKTGLDAEADPGRLALSRVLGFAPDYGRLFAATERGFNEAPPHLRDPRTLEGRVFDGTSTTYPVHAYGTKHEYALMRMTDPAAHVYLHLMLRDLPLRDALLDLTGVRWVVGLEPGKDSIPGDWRAHYARPYGQLVVAERNTSLPAAFFVGEGRPAQSYDDFRHAVITDGPAALRRTAWLACDGSCPQSPPSARASDERAVETTSVSPAAREYRVSPGTGGYVVLSIPWHPDWRAEIDGQEVPVFRANHAFMAVPVGTGGSSIRIHFDHGARTAARAVSALLLVTGALVACLDREDVRRRASSPGRAMTHTEAPA